jgi:hypothetical protein
LRFDFFALAFDLGLFDRILRAAVRALRQDRNEEKTGEEDHSSR